MDATYIDFLQAKAFLIILIMYISKNQLKMVKFRGKHMISTTVNHETQLKPT